MARRFGVIIVGIFPDELQSYSGAAAATESGELIAWNGHRSADGTASGLVYMGATDLAIKVLKCLGRGPDGFEYASSAYDPSSKTLYVFGGWADQGPSNELFRLNLANSPISWEKIVVAGVKPGGRNGAPMVLDAPRGRLIVCGGDTWEGNAFHPVADCWQFDLTSLVWTRLPDNGKPSARWHAAMALDPLRQKAYLFGGAGLGRFDETLYELNLPSTTWRALTTRGSPPPSLQGATFTFDAANNVLVLAGGLRHELPGNATISQAWVFDPAVGQWDESDLGDALRRRDHIGIYRATTGEHILVGGRISGTVGNFYDRGRLAGTDVRIKVRRINGTSVTQP